MLNSEILLLIFLVIASIFGLQGALKLCINHLIQNTYIQIKSCKKILQTKEAFFAKIPIAFLAVIFYGILIFQIIQLSFKEDLYLYWINIEIFFSIIVTIYYAFVMIFKLKIICLDCIRIYVANLLLATSILFYHLT